LSTPVQPEDIATRAKALISAHTPTPTWGKKKFDGLMQALDVSYSATEALIRGAEAEHGDKWVEEISVLGLQAQAGHFPAAAIKAYEDGGVQFDAETGVFATDKSGSEFNGMRLKELQLDMAEKHGISYGEAREYANAGMEGARIVGLYKARDAAHAYASALEAKGNKKQAKKLRAKWKDITLHETREDAEKLASMTQVYPEIAEIIRVKNGIRKWVADFAVDSGLWNRAQADDLLDNADWMPFQRKFSEEEDEGLDALTNYRTGLQASVHARKFKGSEREVNDLFDNFEQWTMYMVRNSMRNHSTAVMSKDLMRYGEAEVTNGMAPGSEHRTSYYYEDGKKHYVLHGDPLVAAMFNSGVMTPPVSKILSTFNNIFRNSIIGMPLFSLKQLFVDSQDAILKSGLPMKFALKIPLHTAKAFYDLVVHNKKSEAQETLEARGLAGAATDIGILSREDLRKATGFHDAEANATGKQKTVLARVRDWGLTLAMHSDNAIRQAVYLATLEAGGSKRSAVLAATDIINFKRKLGNRTLISLSSYTPFFIAALSGSRSSLVKLGGRGISPQTRTAAYRQYLRSTVMLATISALWAMANGDDDDYEKMSLAQRARQWTIPGMGGVGIPRRTSVESLAPIFAEMVINQMTNKAVDGTNLRKAISGVLTESLMPVPEPVPAPIKVVIEQMTNHNVFTGQPIVGYALGQQEAYRQYGMTTSALARGFGKAAEAVGAGDLVSPVRVDHAIRGILGSVGGSVLLLSNLAASAVGARPSMSTGDLMASLPGFTMPAAKEFNNAERDDFYDLLKRTSEIAATAASLKNSGVGEEYRAYVEKHRDELITEKQASRISGQLAKVRKAIHIVAEGPGTSGEQAANIKRLKEIEARMIKAADVKGLRLRAGL
jgi:hypothetical protein